MRSRLVLGLGLVVVGSFVVSCSGEATAAAGGPSIGLDAGVQPDAGGVDAGAVDAGSDAGITDAGDGSGGAATDGGSGSGGGSTSDAGSGGGGSASDAGSDSGGGSASDAGSGAGGGPATDAGSSGGTGDDAGSGGSVDAGSGSGGDVDAGSGGGTSAACQGVVPAELPAPASATVPHADGDECWSASSDGQGFIVADAHAAQESTFAVHWVILDPRGTQSGGFNAGMAIAPQPSGFHGTSFFFSQSSPPSEVAFLEWSETGTMVSNSVIGSDACGPAGAWRVPRGGSIALTICGSGAHGVVHAYRFAADGTRFRKDGSFTGASFGLLFPRFPQSLSVIAGSDVSGNMLIVAYPGSVAGLKDDDFAAQWFDPFGAPLTAVFSAAKGTGEAALRPLVEGDLALQIDGRWVATLSAGSAGPHPVPDWLASRDHFDFEIVRGGKAYALIPRNGAPDTRTLEFLTPGGERCGATTFPIGGLSVGFDGSVIAASGDGGCKKTWWTGLLK
jgi:hypothetical protein